MRVKLRLDFEEWMSEDPETPELLWEKVDEFFQFKGIEANREFVEAMKEKRQMDEQWDKDGYHLGDFLEGYDVRTEF